MNRRCITLITDFGTKDGYVGSMKGVILQKNPEARIIDITHEVSPQDILEAGFVLGNTHRFFPKGSVHLAVVDPGVGSTRRALLVQAGDHFFVGPDNGVFTFIYKNETKARVIELTNNVFFLPDISSTFHGRDIFSPVAAHLSLGTSVDEFGVECHDPVRIEIPAPEKGKGMIKGVILHIDSFGNLISNISKNLFIKSIGNRRYTILVGGEHIKKVHTCYSEGKEEVLAIFGSSGYLEISVKCGNAHDVLALNKGDAVQVVYKTEIH